MTVNELSDMPDLEKRLEGLQSKGKFDKIVELAKEYSLATTSTTPNVKICDVCGKQPIRMLCVLSYTDPRGEHDYYSYFRELPIATTYKLNIGADLKEIDPIIRNRLATRIESLKGTALQNELETAKALLAREGSRTVYENKGGYNSDINYKGNAIFSKYEIRLCDKHNTQVHLDKIISNRIEQFTTAFFGYIPTTAIKQNITKGPTGRKYDV